LKANQLCGRRSGRPTSARWADTARAGGAAGPLCRRIRRWLQPAWGLRLPPADYARNDLTLSSILTDSEKITGMVDWGEFRLGSRALDLIALALDCQQRGAHATADRLLARAASGRRQRGPALPGQLAPRPGLAEDTREGQPSQAEIQAISAIIDRLQAAGS
jgi:aminoglycoside phosphotransferase (APT) family kinase protein